MQTFAIPKITKKKNIFATLAVFVVFFVGAWVTFDVSETFVFDTIGNVEAAIGCGGCTTQLDGGGGGFSFGGGLGGFGGGGDGGGGGGGGGHTQLPAPVCTLDLTKDKITWTSINATHVDIVALTNSPAVPGAVAPPSTPPGTTIFSGDFNAFKFQNLNKLQQEVGGFVIDGFLADKATADQICRAVFPGTVGGFYQSDKYASPKNNTVLSWNGSSWNQFNAKNYNNQGHFRYNFTCITPYISPSKYNLNGMTSFVPPLGVGTHTYKLTASKIGSGSDVCTATVVIPPPPEETPTCSLDSIPSNITPGQSVQLKWTSTNATSGSIDQGIGAISSSNLTSGNKVVYPNATKTYTATFIGNEGSTTCSTEVIVSEQSAPTCSLDVTKNDITWGSTNAQSVTIIPTTNSPAVGTNLSLTGSKTFDPPLGVGTHAYTMAVLGTNGDTINCEGSFKVESPNAPACTLDASPTSIQSGETSTLTWTTVNGHSFEIDHGIGVVTPTSGGSIDTSALTTTTTFTGKVKRNGDYVTCSATVGVLPIEPPVGPTCTLSIDKSQITTGDSATLTWTSNNVVSGFVNKNVGTTTPVSSGSITIFPSNSTTYTGTFKAANNDEATCSASITVITGGCTGNCGGGLNQPTTVLFKKPGDQPLAFVSLSQIPYTGFEAGPILSMLFWLTVIVWSFGIAYVLVGKESMQYVMNQLFKTAPAFIYNGSRTRAQANNQDGSHGHEVEQEYFSQSAEPETTHVMQQQVAAPVPHSVTPHVIHQSMQTEPLVTQDAVDGIPDLASVVESRAHAAGVLLSPEAAQTAAQLFDNRDETLRLFGTILDSAVRTLPREDGWILLSSDALEELRKGSNIPAVKEPVSAQSTPETKNKKTTEAVSESVVSRLAGSIVSGARDEAFTLLRQLENEGANARGVINGVAFALDDVYRARAAHTPAKDMMLAEKAQLIPEEKLAELVEVFTRAFDVNYASAFTAFKISLAQAFDVRIS